MTAPHIHLASNSPRRQALLRQLGVDFDLVKLREAPGRERDVIEGARDAEPPLHYVERMARTKVAAAWQRMHQRRRLRGTGQGGSLHTASGRHLFRRRRIAAR